MEERPSEKDERAPDVGGDNRETYVPPAVAWIEPLAVQAAMMIPCGKQSGGDGQCGSEPAS